MELDDKAIRFLKEAKTSGMSKDDAFAFLQSKGYNLSAKQEKPQIGSVPEKFEPTKGDFATSALNSISLGFGNPLLATAAAGIEKVRGNKTPFSELVGEYGKAIEERQSEYAEKNPKTKFMAEALGTAANLPITSLGGGIAKGSATIASKIAPRIASSLAGKGAIEGAAFGLPYLMTEQAREVGSGQKSISKGVLDTATGTIGGALIGGAIPLTGRGIAKMIGTKAEAGRQAAKILNEAGDKSLEKIVRTDKGTAALQSAIKSNDKLASQIRDISNQKIIEGADRTKEIVRQSLGIDDIQQAKEAANNSYQKLFEEHKGKGLVRLVNGKPTAPIFSNPTVRQALSVAKKQDLLGEIAQSGDNSLLAAQRAKEVLDEMIQRSKVMGDYGQQQPTNLTRQLSQIRNNFINKVDETVPEYKSVRKAYQQAKQSSDLLDSLTSPMGRERSNNIPSLLTNENKEIVSDIFGKKKADTLFNELRKQGIENDRFSKLYSAAEQKLTREPAQKRGLIREALESTGSVVGHGLDLATFKRAGRMRRNIADILLGNRPLSIPSGNIEKYTIRGAIQARQAKGD